MFAVCAIIYNYNYQLNSQPFDKLQSCEPNTILKNVESLHHYETISIYIGNWLPLNYNY